MPRPSTPNEATSTTGRTEFDGLIAVSPARAAELVGLSRAMIYKLLDRGDLRRSKIGNATRIPVADLVALVERGIA